MRGVSEDALGVEPIAPTLVGVCGVDPDVRSGRILVVLSKEDGYRFYYGPGTIMTSGYITENISGRPLSRRHRLFYRDI